MPNTYTELLKTTVGTATSSVTLDLTGISGYTDLVLIVSATNPTNDSGILIRFNSDSGSNYSDTSIYGNGSPAVSFRASNATGMNAGRTDTGISTNIINIQNYANTTTYKTVLTRGNDSALVIATVGLWRNTAAITSITVYDQNARNFSTGSTFSLYGIANADQGAAKATGGIITEDATYYYHTFVASGTFTPKQSLTCDVLAVAGGAGGGGGAIGGGGGAGGFRVLTAQSLGAYTFTVTVGGGGNGGIAAGSYTSATNGVDSSIIGTGLSITSTGGGKGGGGNATDPGGNGGSGGGGNYLGSSAGSGNTPSTSPSQGSAGALGGASNYGGGGGGLSAAGSNQNGGNGSSAYSSWGSVTGTGQDVSGTYWYAGGAGGGSRNGTAGGTGGNGGGAAGRTAQGNGLPGTANTGGAGSGSGYTSNPDTNGGAGGSGLVIVRYAK